MDAYVHNASSPPHSVHSTEHTRAEDKVETVSADTTADSTYSDQPKINHSWMGQLVVVPWPGNSSDMPWVYGRIGPLRWLTHEGWMLELERVHSDDSPRVVHMHASVCYSLRELKRSIMGALIITECVHDAQEPVLPPLKKFTTKAAAGLQTWHVDQLDRLESELEAISCMLTGQRD